MTQDAAISAPEVMRVAERYAERRPDIEWARRLLPAIPESVAAIEDAWNGGGRRTVLLVQDAHTNNSAQLNEAALLDILYSQTEDLSRRLYLEAGSGDESISFFRSYAEAEKRRRVARNFLLQAKLQGVEYLDLTSGHDFVLYGVEDMTLYERSVELYRAISGKREKLKNYLDRVENTAEALKPRLLNPFLLAFDRTRLKYARQEISTTEYFGLLAAQAKRIGLPFEYPHLKTLNKLREAEQRIDFRKASEEEHRALLSLRDEDRLQAQELLKAPSKHGQRNDTAFFHLLKDKIADLPLYPNLSLYLDYLKEAESLNSKEILKEQRSLEEAIAKALTVHADETALMKAVEHVQALKQLLYLKFTPDDYESYKKNRGASGIRGLTGFLNRKIMDGKEHYDKTLFLEEGYDEAVRECESFYELTRERDRAFLANMTAADDGKPLRVLVAGGYHTSNLKELLKKQGTSYISLMPQVFSETNMERYEEILLGQKSVFGKTSIPAAGSANMTRRQTLTPAGAARLAEALDLSEAQTREVLASAAAKGSGENLPAPGARLAAPGEIPQKKAEAAASRPEIIRRSEDRLRAALLQKGSLDLFVGELDAALRSKLHRFAFHAQIDKLVSDNLNTQPSLATALHWKIEALKQEIQERRFEAVKGIMYRDIIQFYEGDKWGIGDVWNRMRTLDQGRITLDYNMLSKQRYGMQLREPGDLSDEDWEGAIEKILSDRSDGSVLIQSLRGVTGRDWLAAADIAAPIHVMRVQEGLFQGVFLVLAPLGDGSFVPFILMLAKNTKEKSGIVAEEFRRLAPFSSKEGIVHVMRSGSVPVKAAADSGQLAFYTSRFLDHHDEVILIFSKEKPDDLSRVKVRFNSNFFWRGYDFEKDERVNELAGMISLFVYFSEPQNGTMIDGFSIGAGDANHNELYEPGSALPERKHPHTLIAYRGSVPTDIPGFISELFGLRYLDTYFEDWSSADPATKQILYRKRESDWVPSFIIDAVLEALKRGLIRKYGETDGPLIARQWLEHYLNQIRRRPELEPVTVSPRTHVLTSPKKPIFTRARIERFIREELTPGARLASDAEIYGRMLAFDARIVPLQQKADLLERRIESEEGSAHAFLPDGHPLIKQLRDVRADLAAAHLELKAEIQAYIKEPAADAADPDAAGDRNERAAVYDVFVGFQERTYESQRRIWTINRRLAQFARKMGVSTPHFTRLEKAADPHWTMDHILRVTMRAILVAHEYGLRGKELKELALGAMIHDLGKTKTSKYLLNAVPAEMPEGGYDEIRKHVMTGGVLFREAYLYFEYLKRRTEILAAVQRRVSGWIYRLWDRLESVAGWDIYTGIKGSLPLTVGPINKVLWDIGDISRLIEIPELEDILKALRTDSSLYRRVSQIILEHHETLNATGYPDRIKNENPISHIVQLADIHDAARSPRPYKRTRPKSWEEISDISAQFSRSSGVLFLPAAVDAWKRVAWDKSVIGARLSDERADEKNDWSGWKGVEFLRLKQELAGSLSERDRALLKDILTSEYGMNADKLADLIKREPGKVYIKSDEIDPTWGEGRKVYLELDAESQRNLGKKVLALKGVRPQYDETGEALPYDDFISLGLDRRPLVIRDGMLAVGTPVIAPKGGMAEKRAELEYDEMETAAVEAGFGTETAMALGYFSGKNFRGQRLAFVISALDGTDERLAIAPGRSRNGEDPVRVLHASNMKDGNGTRFSLPTSLEFMKAIGKALRAYHFRENQSRASGSPVRRFHRYPHFGNLEIVRDADLNVIRVNIHDLDTTLRSEDLGAADADPEFLETGHRIIDLLMIIYLLNMESSMVPSSESSAELTSAFLEGYFYDSEIKSARFQTMLAALQNPLLHRMVDMLKTKHFGINTDLFGPLGEHHPLLGGLWRELSELRGREDRSISAARLAVDRDALSAQFSVLDNQIDRSKRLLVSSDDGGLKFVDTTRGRLDYAKNLLRDGDVYDLLLLLKRIKAEVPANAAFSEFLSELDKAITMTSGARLSAGTDDPLKGAVIIRYADSYNTPGGVSTYLRDLNQGILSAHDVTIYQFHPITGKELIKKTYGEIETIGKGRIIHMPIDMGAVLTAPSDAEAPVAAAGGVRSKIGYFVRNFVNKNLKDFLRYLLFLPEMLPITKRLPVVGERARKILRTREAFSAGLDTLRASIAGKKVLFINHSPENPLSLSLGREVQRRSIPAAYQLHGGPEFSDRQILKVLSRTSKPSGVTLRNLRSAMGYRAENLADGIDTDFFDPAASASEKGSFRRSRGLDPAAPLILLPSRITRNKGHDVLEKAFFEIMRQARDTGRPLPILVFAGDSDGEFAPELKRFAEDRGIADRVVFTGNLAADELRRAYLDADVMVLPSKGEGLPRVILEAQSMQVPVVATDAGGSREGLVNGRTGYLVRIGDADSMARRIAELLNDPAKRGEFGRAGRRYVSENYSLNTLVDRHAAFYLRSMGDGSRLAASVSEQRLPADLPKDAFILVPVFNEEKRLSRIIQKAREGGYLDRVIFVNDASSDRSLEYIKSVPDAFYVSFSSNQQKEGALAASLDHLEAEYVRRSVPFPAYFAAVDGDTYLEPTSGDSSVIRELMLAAAQMRTEDLKAMSFRIRADLDTSSTAMQWVQAVDWAISGGRSIPGGGTIYDAAVFRESIKASKKGFFSRPIELKRWFKENGYKIGRAFQGLTAKTEVETTLKRFIRERGKWAYGFQEWYGRAVFAAIVLAVDLIFGFILFHDGIFSGSAAGTILLSAVLTGASLSLWKIWRGIKALFYLTGWFGRPSSPKAGRMDILLLFLPLTFATLLVYTLYSHRALFLDYYTSPPKRPDTDESDAEGARLAGGSAAEQRRYRALFRQVMNLLDMTDRADVKLKFNAVKRLRQLQAAGRRRRLDGRIAAPIELIIGHLKNGHIWPSRQISVAYFLLRVSREDFGRSVRMLLGVIRYDEQMHQDPSRGAVRDIAAELLKKIALDSANQRNQNKYKTILSILDEELAVSSGTSEHGRRLTNIASIIRSYDKSGARLAAGRSYISGGKNVDPASAETDAHDDFFRTSALDPSGTFSKRIRVEPLTPGGSDRQDPQIPGGNAAKFVSGLPARSRDALRKILSRAARSSGDLPVLRILPDESGTLALDLELYDRTPFENFEGGFETEKRGIYLGGGYIRIERFSSARHLIRIRFPKAPVIRMAGWTSWKDIEKASDRWKGEDAGSASGLTAEHLMYAFDFGNPDRVIRETAPDFSPKSAAVIGAYKNSADILRLLKTFPSLEEIHLLDIDGYSKAFFELEEDLERLRREEAAVFPKIYGYRGTIVEAPSKLSGKIDLVYDKYVFADSYFSRSQLLQSGREIQRLLRDGGVHISGGNAHRFTEDLYAGSRMKMLADEGDYTVYFKRQTKEEKDAGARLADQGRLTEAEKQDLKLYLAAISKENAAPVEAGKHFAVQFGAGVFEFRPSRGAGGSLDVYLAGRSGAEPVVSLTADDISRLLELRRTNPGSLKQDLVQGAMTAIKLHDQAVLAASAVEDLNAGYPVNIAFPMSIFSDLEGDELDAQIRFQFLRLQEFHKTKYGRSTTFYLYGAPEHRVLEAVQQNIEPFSGFIRLGRPEHAVVYVDTDENALPALAASQLSLPTGKIPKKGVGNLWALAAQGLRGWHDASAGGIFAADTLVPGDIKSSSLNSYNTLAIASVDAAGYAAIAGHKESAGESVLGRMKKHLLRGYIPMPVDIDASMVIAALIRMSERSA